MSQYDICQLPSMRYSGGAMGPYDVAANHVHADDCGNRIHARVSVAKRHAVALKSSKGSMLHAWT